MTDLDPQIHKFLRKIAKTLDESATRYLEPVKELPAHQAALTPNYAIAVAIKEVSDVIARELES